MHKEDGSETGKALILKLFFFHQPFANCPDWEDTLFPKEWDEDDESARTSAGTASLPI